MRIPKKNFAHAGTKKIKTASAREALMDFRCWACLAIVEERGGSHFEVTEDDIIVYISMMPSEEPIDARMGTVGGGEGVGVWFIPPPGSEVAVIIPDGEVESDPIIVGVLSSGSLPDGIEDGVTVIANTKNVLITDGKGNHDQLVTRKAYAAHIHPTGVGPSSPADNAMVETSYTQILKAT